MFRDLFGRAREKSAPPASDEEKLRVAAAALLVEAAAVDDRFEAAERAAIGLVLERHFGVAAGEAHRLLEAGERTRDASAQLYGFTRTINERLNAAERIGLLEMLWEVAYADGALDPLEDTLLRRIGGLVDVPDRERGLARRRVLARLGRDETTTETEP
jgi:uncharacterized tellurite resistance protein B-like protein